MEMITRKMSLIVVALVLLAAGIQTRELQARGEGHSGGGSHSMGSSRGGSRSAGASRGSSRQRTQNANSSRGNRRGEGRGQYGRHQNGRNDGRGNRNGYYNDSGEWIVPGAIGLGVGAAVLGSEGCPEGTYFDELSGQCIEE